MKKFRLSILLLAALSAGVSGHAQLQQPEPPSGIVMTTYAFTPADMLLYSQSGYSFGTARSSAMGGAFASLGGDLASIGMNPAGIAMYRSSVWGFSPSLTVSNTRTNGSQGFDTGRTRFAFNNIGAVLRVSERSRGLVGFNMGFSYNKAADFNFRTGATLPAGSSSLMDIFQLQLNGLGVVDSDGWQGISKGSLEGGNPFANESIGLNEWGSVLAYLTYGLDPVNNSPDNVLYRIGTIGHNALIVPSLAYNSRGSVGEYNISAGMNFNNVLYLGFGLTIQDIFQHQEIMFSEQYDYDGIDGPPQEYLQSMTYNQSSRMTGTGVNFKLGIIARPVAGLRLGIAVHTPTAVDLTHEYLADMETRFWGNDVVSALSDVNLWSYNYSGPTRLMGGISYTFGNVAAISVDYEKVFYNGMRLTAADQDVRDAYREHIKEYYRGADNFRAGIEVKPLPVLALRAGYSYYGSPYKLYRNRDIVTTRFTPAETQSISAGVGFWLGDNTTLDLAYIYSKTNYADVLLYGYAGEGYLPDAEGNGYYAQDLLITPSDMVRKINQNRHTVTMSFNFMF